MSFVLDCSMALAWFMSDEVYAPAYDCLQLLEEQTALVPANWPFEVVNALVVAQRRGRITLATAQLILSKLSALPIEIEQISGLSDMSRTFELSHRANLSAYDAAYLELAIRKKLPLATVDQQLAAAARSANVSSIG